MKKYTIEYWVETIDGTDDREIEIIAMSTKSAIKEAKSKVIGRKFKVIDMKKLSNLEQEALKRMPKSKMKHRVVIKGRRSGEMKHFLIRLHNDLKNGETIYYGTKNREWFKWRFKNINKVPIKMELISESLYKLSL